MPDPDSGSASAQPSSPGGNAAPAAAGPAPACTMVIFGAHGDLTKRLLMPALYNLCAGRLLPDGFRVIGVDRVEGSDESWRRELSETMQDFTRDPNAEFYVKEIDQEVWGWVTRRLTYHRADFTSAADVKGLGEALEGSVLFYLAVAARFFGGIVDQLGSAGLLAQEGDRKSVV